MLGAVTTAPELLELLELEEEPPELLVLEEPPELELEEEPPELLELELLEL